MSDNSKDGSVGPHGSDSPEANPGTTSPAVPSAPPVAPGMGLPGDFGDYRFIERIGKGAFGEVFKVWSLSKCCYEAMKVLRCDGSPTSERLEAFRREIQRMAHVAGSHVAHVYHTGTLPDGRPYFTMEYLSGGPIDGYCDRHRKTIEDRILYVADICEAVDRLGLVHCDIKPGNIVVGEESGVAVPKLVDFGLARLLAFELPASLPVCGTLAYMSPEQLESRGGDPERRWDIYALGVTLYRLLVDEYPIDHFPGRFLRAEELADYIRRTPVPPLVAKLPWDSTERTDGIAEKRKLNAETLRVRLRDRWLEPIVVKALAKDRDDRYASAGEMARNLRVYASGKRPPIVPPTLRDRATEFLRDHLRAVASATVLVAVASLFAWGYLAKAAARRELVEKLFAQGCSEAQPFLAMQTLRRALDLAPTRSDIRLHLAGANLTGGNSEEAIAIARAIPPGDPRAGDAAAFVRGVDQFRARAGDLPIDGADGRVGVAPGEEYYYSLTFRPTEAHLAIALLNRALENSRLTHGDRVRIRLMRAMRFDQAGDFDKLTSEAQWLVDTIPDSAVAWNLRGICEWRAGRKEDALRDYNRALALNPEYAAVYRNRGELNFQRSRHVEALRDCERAVAIETSMRPFVLHIRINALTGLRQDSAARAECEALESEPLVTSQAHDACGNVWMLQDMAARAWVQFDLAVNTVDPRDPSAHELRYVSLQNRATAARDGKRFAEAAADFDAAAECLPSRWRADPYSYQRRGLARMLAMRLDDAVADLDQFSIMKKTDPGTSLVQLWVWDVHLAAGRTAEAGAALRAAAESARNDERLSRIVGHCSGEVAREAVLNDAAGNSKREAEAYYYLGLAAKARKDHEAAQKEFASCLERRSSRQVEATLLADWQRSLMSAGS